MEAILGMVNSQEDPTVEQMIVECQKENPNEKEEIAKIGEALTLEIENRKEKLESGVGDITHTFSDEFNNRVKVEKTIKPIQKGKTVSQRGGVQRTRAFAKAMDCPLAIIDKRRTQHNVAVADHVIGDVKDKICVMFDDMIDTAGTICEAAKLLKREGAKDVYVCAVHPVFSGPALKRLDEAPIKEVIVTNTIPLNGNEFIPTKITQLSVAPLLGEAISRIHDDQSVSSLFGFEKEYKS